MSFTLQELALHASGRVVRDTARPVSGAALDSRTVQPGMLFAALAGDRVDGHDFCGDAVKRGAAALLVQRDIAADGSAGIIRAPSVEGALQELGKSCRAAFQGKVLGVVGSAGKTTTKEFLAAVLARKAATEKSPGNRNNLLGLPESLMNLDQEAAFWVLELGISRPDEMAELAPIALPDGVVFTTIQPVHLEFFPSQRAIFEEKARVLNWTDNEGFAVVNEDDPYLSSLVLPPGMRRLSYGASARADVRLLNLREAPDGSQHFELAYRTEAVPVHLPLSGRHQAWNFAAACAGGLACGMKIEQAAAAAQALKPAPHRGETALLADGILLVDDSYNSNPNAAASVLKSLSGKGRRVAAVLGQMNELGPESRRFHQETGKLAGDCVDVLLAVGNEDALALCEEFARTGKPAHHEAAWENGAEWIASQLEAGDVLLVKGSRTVGLEGLVQWLKQRGGRA
jgi:UDP-N-acetylmuramoyl-tripeptide--D-alanyl-D-alanine ligase